MEIQVRPILQFLLFLATLVFILAAINSNEISRCDAEYVTLFIDDDNTRSGSGDDDGSFAKTINLAAIYTFHSIKISTTQTDTLSMRTFSWFENSYDPFFVEPSTGNIPNYAKTSYILLILVAFLLVILLAVYIKSNQNDQTNQSNQTDQNDKNILSRPSSILALFTFLCALTAAILITVISTIADPTTLNEDGGDPYFDSANIYKPCVLANSGYFAWTAVATFAILSIELMRFVYMKRV
jgi:hypothetical protein